MSSPQQQKAAVEAFSRGLSDYFRQQAVNIPSFPPIGGKNIPPYFIYMAVKKLGGFTKISQNNSWQDVLRVLGLNTDPKSVEDISMLYTHFIEPYVQFCIQQQQSSSSLHQVSLNNDLQEVSSNSSSSSIDNTNRNAQSVDTNSRQIEDSHGNLKGSAQSTEEINGLSQGTGIAPNVQAKQQLNQNETKLYNPELKPKPLLHLTSEKNKYVPKKRKIEFKGGYDIQLLGRLGKDADKVIPEFPVLEELGVVNLHTITQSLKSSIPGEVRQALDKLALISSNPYYNIILRDCPGLADALGYIGLDLLKYLEKNEPIIGSKGRSKPDDTETLEKHQQTYDYDNEEEDGTDLISSVFTAFSSWDKANDDVTFHVDSLTGYPANEYQDESAIRKLEDMIQDDDTNFNNENSAQVSMSNSDSSTFSKSSYFGFPSYIDLLDLSKAEVDELHKHNKSHISFFWDESYIDRLICVTMVLRNISFTDLNQSYLAQEPTVMEFLFRLVRILGSSSEVVKLKRRQLSIQKNIITLFANLGLHIIIPSAADAFSVLLLILSFSPEQFPFRKNEDGSESLFFGEYDPTVDRYLGCAIDSLAKIIPRDPPNRTFFQDIFLNTCNDSDYLELLNRHLQGRQLRPFEFLTRTFALSLSTLPRSDFRLIPRALELRASLIQQSLLVASNLSSMVPKYGYFDDIIQSLSSSQEQMHHLIESLILPVLEKQTKINLANIWLNSVESFGPTLLRASCTLRPPEVSSDIATTDIFNKITFRTISVLRTLSERAMSFDVAINDSLSNPESQNFSQKAPDISMKVIPGVFPTFEILFSALVSNGINPSVVSELCQLAEDHSNYFSSIKLLQQKYKATN